MIKDNLSESLRSVLPIALAVVLLCVTLTPMSAGDFFLFLTGVLCLVAGLALFAVGSELAMLPLGSKVGVRTTQSGKVWLIALVAFFIGLFVTVSEPDVHILAEQISAVPKTVLVPVISVGVGLSLLLALLRILWRVPLRRLLLVSYTLAFVLCFFVPPAFWSAAFDTGGVTTGTMTVPFILALGAGVSSIASRDSARDDSFGLLGLCSIGPVIAVLLLGILYRVEGGSYELAQIPIVTDTRAGALVYLRALPDFAGEVGLALLPIAGFALLFQLLTRSFTARQMLRIGVGMLFTFMGVVLFMMGANLGFLPAGYSLGASLAGMRGGYILIPVAMLLGYFMVAAEPTVHVLVTQVEQISAGAIPARKMAQSLAIGVSAALGLFMVKLLTGMSIMYLLVPGYIVALALTFVVPPIFTGISFDAGGVASGTMAAAFILPLTIGASSGLGLNVMTEAFGCVAIVALPPVIAVEVWGLVYRTKVKRAADRLVAVDEFFINYSVERTVD